MAEFEEQEYTKKFDLELWKKLVGCAVKHKKLFYSLLATNLFLALVDMAFPLMTSYAIDNFITNHNFETLGIFIVGYVILILLLAGNVYMFISLASRMESTIVYDIRKRGFEKLQELSLSYYDRTPLGWMIARMTSDVQAIGGILGWGFIDLLYAFSMLIIGFIIMFAINAKLALLIIIVMPILAVLSVYFQKKILLAHRASRKINSRITSAFSEGINGAKTTKTLIREEKNFEEFKDLTLLMKKTQMSITIYSAAYLPLVLSIGSVGVALVISVGGNDFLNGTISMGQLFIFISFATQIFEPIRQIAGILSELQDAQASGERTFSLLETTSDIVDREDVVEKYGDFINPKKENWESIKGDIEFRDVSFSYKIKKENEELEETESILEEFNLTIKSGEKIALVGETGSGKSTIVNLICRFYEPTSGQILIDGKDYRERSQIWLHSNIGYVLQNPHLFSGSIKDNIRYSKLEATDEEIINAAKKVNAYNFIIKLEKGFDTEVGEGGNKLSSGQKQLISFARAILGNPSIFVLDEATSSIDTETEQVVQKAIDEVLRNRTSFIVAHRLSTIRSADRILVISRGKVIESGSHKQLIKQRGHYYNLYTNQFKEEAEQSLLNNR